MRPSSILCRRRAPLRIAGAVLWAVLALASSGQARAEAGPTAPGPSPAAVTPDEQARALFRGGRFAEALQIYQRLRTETHHPTYLRNIGRCHQMMRQPAPAIDAFDAYLREVPALDAAERAEVQSYIVEMRALQASASPSAAPAPSPSAAPGTATTLDMTAPVAAAAPTHLDESPPPDRETDRDQPTILHRWWFWAGVGAVALTAGIVAVAAASGGPSRLPCPSGAVCP